MNRSLVVAYTALQLITTVLRLKSCKYCIFARKQNGDS